MLGASGRQRLRAQPVGRSMLGAIDELAEEEREGFGLLLAESVTAGSRCARSRRTSMRRLPPGS